jgi:hypothetical protein
VAIEAAIREATLRLLDRRIVQADVRKASSRVSNASTQ